MFTRAHALFLTKLRRKKKHCMRCLLPMRAVPEPAVHLNSRSIPRQPDADVSRSNLLSQRKRLPCPMLGDEEIQIVNGRNDLPLSPNLCGIQNKILARLNTSTAQLLLLFFSVSTFLTPFFTARF